MYLQIPLKTLKNLESDSTGIETDKFSEELNLTRLYLNTSVQIIEGDRQNIQLSISDLQINQETYLQCLIVQCTRTSYTYSSLALVFI